MNLFRLTTVCAAATLATAAFAASAPSAASERALRASGSDVLQAREREAGDDRGRGGRRNDDKAPHKLGDDTRGTSVAREGGEAPRGEGKGHPVSDDAPATLALV